MADDLLARLAASGLSPDLLGEVAGRLALAEAKHGGRAHAESFRRLVRLPS